MKLCEYCNKELAANEICECEESKAHAREQNKKRKRYLIGGVAIMLVIVIAVVIMTIGTTSVKIDPLNYTTVSFEGYSSNGVAKVEFDKDSLICDIIGDEPDSLDDLMEWLNKYDMYSEGIEYSFSPSQKLSNGDTVTVTFSITGTAQNKIQSVTKEFTVEGLTEIEKVDVFKELSVSFEGLSGEADVVIERNTDSKFINACNFQCENQFNLSNGDRITLFITNSDELASTYAKIPIALSKEYEVSGLGYYATKADQIPKELIEDFAEQFVKEKQKETEDESDTSFSYSTVKYYASYFMYPKENAFMVNENELHIVVWYDSYYFNEYLRTNYVPIVFEDIIVNADGTVNLQYEDGSSSTFTTDMDLYVEDLEEDYIVTKYEDLDIDGPTNATEPTNTTEPANTAEPTEPSKAPDTPQVNLSHNHNYYRPQQPYFYVDNCVWDGSGGRSEQDLGKIFPTCTERGFTVYVCSDCGHVKYDDYVPALGHSHTTWYVAKEATTTDTGTKESMCDRCGSSDIITEIIPKKTVESYIDPGIEVQNVFGKKKYKYGNCSVWNSRTWGNVFSISVLENGGLHVTYDNQNNEIIEFDVLPPAVEGILNSAVIRDNGSYDIQLVGAFS